MKIDTSKLTRRDFLGGSIGVLGSVFMSGCNSNNDTTSTQYIASNQVNIVTSNENGTDIRVVTTNGYPKHSTGEFPSPACPYGVGSEETLTFKMPLVPTLRTPASQSPASIYENYHRFGVAINGVTFDPAGPAWDENNTWHVEVLSFNAAIYLGIDQNNAHVQPYDREGGADESLGEYHYHGFPQGLFAGLFAEDKTNQTNKKMFLLGYAADGYPIYAPQAPIDPNDENSQIVELHPSYKLKNGLRADIIGQSKRPAGNYEGTFVEDYEFDSTLASNGDEFLDEYNGRTGWTPEYPNGTYYYVATKTFPFVPRMFKGELLPPASQDAPTFETMNFVHPQAPGEDQIPDSLKVYPSA
jgi:hypothetical protein